MKFPLFVSLFAILFAVAPSCYGQIEPTESNISYLVDGGEGSSGYRQERCKLDLYLPDGVDGFPVVIWFHGGGLKGGDKAKEEEALVLVERFRDAGIGVISVNYRLSPKEKYPSYIEDVAASIAWTHRNIADHGGDPGKLFVSGHSAGGYLAAIVSIDPRWLGEHSLTAEVIRGILPVSGQMDTHSTVKEERGIGPSVQVIDEAAPIHHSAAHLPPILLLCADNDLEKRVEVNEQFVRALSEAGNENVELIVCQDRNHVSLVTRMLEPEDAVSAAMIEWIGELSE